MGDRPGRDDGDGLARIRWLQTNSAAIPLQAPEIPLQGVKNSAVTGHSGNHLQPIDST
jgi:hypothetical protein